MDACQPYTTIGGDICYSGRHYDEAFVEDFIRRNRLPANATTAFLTPCLRNIDQPLTVETELVGRPRRLYETAIRLLADAQAERVTAWDLLTEVIRCLIIVRDEMESRMQSLLAELETTREALPLSAEAIVTLLEQHLACRHASRLPVLIVAAAYNAASDCLGERVLPLESHNAADRQTGSPGDLSITLMDDGDIVTSYEMKTRIVTTGDIDHALEKVLQCGNRIGHYVFITTDRIEEEVRVYAASQYERTQGTEFVVLDCIGFLRHFLHLFHRLRQPYLEAYQSLVLTEPNSAVGQPLKEVFLTLRRSAESNGNA